MEYAGRHHVSPRLLIPSNVVLPPVEFWRGTSPSHAASCRPLWNVFASPMLATNAVAVSGPIPGIAATR
jgi:hypothetical protein